MTFPTRNDLFRAARDEILTQNALLSADAVERDGTDVNLLVAAGSAMADKVIGQLIVVAAGLFLDSAQGTALDRLVFDRYGLTRKAAAPGQVNLQFTTATPAPASFTIPVGTVIATSDGIQYSTVVAVGISAGSSGPVYAQATSLLSGSNQQVKIGTLTNIVSQITGAPNNLIVTNLYASAGAADREQDSALRSRAQAFWTTAQRGTLAAIETGALTVPGVVRATALEVLDGNARPGRWVLLIIADTFTLTLASLNQTTPSYAAQSQALAVSVFNALDEYRCGGIFVQVAVAQVILLSISLSLTFAAGVNTLAVANQAQAVVAAYCNELNPGQAFVPSAAIQALQQVAGLVITGNEIAVPAGTVQPTTLQVLRTTAALINASSGGLPISPSVNPDTLIVLQ
jgi:hypothetical protein